VGGPDSGGPREPKNGGSRSARPNRLRRQCDDAKTFALASSSVLASAPLIAYFYFMISLLLILQPFNGLFSWTTWVSRYQKGKPIWILLEQETMSGSGISWAICKSAPRSRQITMPVPHHCFFTGRMPFLPPKQQRQSTEGYLYCLILTHKFTVHFGLQQHSVTTTTAPVFSGQPG